MCWLDRINRSLAPPPAWTGHAREHDPASDRFPPTNTEVIAISIPGLNQPQSIFDPVEEVGENREASSGSSPEDKPGLHTTYLMDQFLDTMGDTSAVESDAMHAIIAHQWRHFGYAYAVEEAVYYLFFFVAPLVAFAVSLDAIPASSNDANYRDTIVGRLRWDASLNLVVSTVWILRQLRVEKKQHFAGDSKEYFRNFWNRVDAITILLFFATVSSFLVGANLFSTRQTALFVSVAAVIGLVWVQTRKRKHVLFYLTRKVSSCACGRREASVQVQRKQNDLEVGTKKAIRCRSDVTMLIIGFIATLISCIWIWTGKDQRNTRIDLIPCKQITACTMLVCDDVGVRARGGEGRRV